jgi:hypothetical protein
MAKLCKGCQEKKADLSVRGSCQTPNILPPGHPLPDKHTPWTDSINFSLCDACAEKFEVCAWCWGPLDGTGQTMVPTDKPFCRQFLDNNGNHVEGMFVGEQILAQLAIDLFARKNWVVKRLSTGVKFNEKCSRLVRTGGQYAWLELYFDLNLVNSKAEIELEEVQGSGWSSKKTGNTWKITVEVMSQ